MMDCECKDKVRERLNAWTGKECMSVGKEKDGEIEGRDVRLID